MPIDSAEKRPYYGLIETNNALEGKTMKKMLMNLQGKTFTEAQAREYYGSRFDSTQLVWVEVDEDGEIV